MVYAIGMPKKVNYSPGPALKRLEKSLTVRQAIVPEVIKEEDLKRRAIRLALKGRDHEHIARRLQATTQQVHAWVKEKLQAYIRESYDPEEVRELMAKRYDNIMYVALYQAMPHPVVDEYGRPVIGNVCKCDLDEGVLCWQKDHTAPRISRPDPTWAKIYLEILSEQKQMYGVDAADKLKAKVVDTMERVYKGVPQDVIDKL